MSPRKIIRYLERLQRRERVLIGALVALTIAFPILTYTMALYSPDRIAKRAAQQASEKRAQQIEERAQEIHDRLTNPKSGTTPERMAAVSIGMTGDEVRETLGLRYSLGIEHFPYSHRYNEVGWVSNDIPIKNIGWVQAVLIEGQLVGLGSLDPNDGPLCGGCLEDMLKGERPRRDGLPFQTEGECPVCGSGKVVPYGSQWGKYNSGNDLCCDIDVALFRDFRRDVRLGD